LAFLFPFRLFHFICKKELHKVDARPHLPEEKLLFARIAGGDEDAFRKVFHFYMPSFFPMIVQVTKSGSIAEDIIQETFLRLWIHRDKLPEIRNPRAWLLRIAYLQAFTYLRDQNIHYKAVARIAAAELNTDETELSVSFRETSALIKKAVEELPKQQKIVYRLSREKGYKTARISSEMGLSEQSVKNTLVRALKFIRNYLEKAGHTLLLLFFT
jgi:RNA polymerase sigma-70 factor (family 1)